MRLTVQYVVMFNADDGLSIFTLKLVGLRHLHKCFELLYFSCLQIFGNREHFVCISSRRAVIEVRIHNLSIVFSIDTCMFIVLLLRLIET